MAMMMIALKRQSEGCGKKREWFKYVICGHSSFVHIYWRSTRSYSYWMGRELFYEEEDEMCEKECTWITLIFLPTGCKKFFLPIDVQEVANSLSFLFFFFFHWPLQSRFSPISVDDLIHWNGNFLPFQLPFTFLRFPPQNHRLGSWSTTKKCGLNEPFHTVGGTLLDDGKKRNCRIGVENQINKVKGKGHNL